MDAYKYIYIYIYTEMGIHDMYYTYMLTTLKLLKPSLIIITNKWENMGYTWDIHYWEYAGCPVLVMEGVVSSHMVCRVSKMLEIHSAHTMVNLDTVCNLDAVLTHFNQWPWSYN